MTKLSRKDIKQGMQSLPVERILLGTQAKNLKLTPKQKRFAEELVNTGCKTEAYKRSYNTQGKRETAGCEASRLSRHPQIATYVTALEAAKAAEEYLLPSRLREMLISKLSAIALSDTTPLPQQLRAIELAGKISSVALFTEHKTLTVNTSSTDIRTRLVDQLRRAISSSSRIDYKAKATAEDLLAEITGSDIDDAEPITIDAQPGDPADQANTGSESGENDLDATPPPPTPAFSTFDQAGLLHSIPHKESTSIPHKESTNLNEDFQNKNNIVNNQDVLSADPSAHSPPSVFRDN